MNRSVSFSLLGALLGALAPVGWMILRLFFFSRGEGTLWQQIAADIVDSPEHLALYVYMGVGTAAVFALFGYLIGQSLQHLTHRAETLDQLNHSIAEQKEEYEKLFQELDQNIQNFHSSNAHIQKSINIEQVMHLAAESLHDILGYDRINILVLTPSRQELEFIASVGTGNEEIEGSLLPFDNRAGIIRKAIQGNQIYLVDDVRELSEDYHLKPPYDQLSQLRSRSFIMCPITMNGEPVGVFGVDNKYKRKTLTGTDVNTVRLFADQISTVLTKIKLLEGLESLTGEIEQTFGEMLQYRKTFSGLVETLQANSESTHEKIEKVSGAVGVIRNAVDDTSSASREISFSIEHVSDSLSQLNQFMEKTVTAMSQINASAKGVEDNAMTSQQLSEQVRVHAERGVEQMSASVNELDQISHAVNQAIDDMNFLAQKSRDIEDVMTVINDVNQRTNLLSLNASIIAAQAGVHGKPFLVVAEEIRGLSNETATSSQSIENTVTEIQTATRKAVANINEIRHLVDKDMHLSRETEAALEKILVSATAAMEKSSEIRQTTAEQVQSSRSVSESIGELGEMSAQVSTASREQTEGIQRISRAIEEIKSMIHDVAEATGDQETDAKQLREAINVVSDMTGKIFEGMVRRKEESKKVIGHVERIKQLSRTVVSSKTANRRQILKAS